MPKTRKYRKRSYRKRKGRGSAVRGWAKLSPGTHQRTLMMKKCGKKCFLGPNKSFPICSKGTCKRNKKGIEAAYMRAREYITIKGKQTYRNIANKAYKLLH